MLMNVLQVEIRKLVTSMGGVLHTKTSLDVSFVIVKNVLAAKYMVSFHSLILFDFFLHQSC